MVCDGPDPPENDAHELTPPPRHSLANPAEESDEDNHDHMGLYAYEYEPLPQGPDVLHGELENGQNQSEDNNSAPVGDIPTIVSMDDVIAREVWNTPRSVDPIQMDNERVQQVMSAMANFALPQASIPEWAQSISEEQWKETLNDRIANLRNNC